MSEIDQKLESLRRGMDFGIANGKANLIVDLVCLDALFKAMDELVKTRKVACDLGFVAQDVIVEERLRIEAALEAMAARAARVCEPAYIAENRHRLEMKLQPIVDAVKVLWEVIPREFDPEAK